jgi:hypothetical protein
MNEIQQPASGLGLDLEENARIGYQAAVDLWIAEGEQIWARFNAMLVVNSIIVAVIGFALAGQRMLPIITVSLPIAGLVVCAVWYVLMKRDFEYQAYLIYSAREIEERYLNPIKTVSRGGAFVRGQAVELVISGASVKRRMSRIARMFRDRTAAHIVILVFAVVYVAMLFQA